MKQQILAIDDEPDLLRLIQRIINEKTQYSITLTNNSLEVPKLLEENEYDVIITDLKMPGIDGIDILKYIKSNNRPEQVIIITAFGTLESAIESMTLGVFDYITKPFKKEQIIFAIDRAMKYQANLKEIKRIAKIFNIEPYNLAEPEFKKEYLLRKMKTYSNDINLIASKTNIPNNEIVSIIDNKND